jgi:hypothetical protein
LVDVAISNPSDKFALGLTFSPKKSWKQGRHDQSEEATYASNFQKRIVHGSHNEKNIKIVVILQEYYTVSMRTA